MINPFQDRKLKEKLSGKQIMITGGLGMIGSNIDLSNMMQKLQLLMLA
jgi:FlaA1/EpsC-like NDP-sugar epimerase